MDKIDYMYIGALIGAVFMIIVCTIIIINVDKNKPSALDVYRGKTTLEITYRDNIPINSVVAFK